MNPIITQLFPIIVMLIALVFIVYRSKTTHFECPSCGCAFKQSIFSYALAPHAFNRRYTTCPNCSYSGMMDVISDKE